MTTEEQLLCFLYRDGLSDDEMREVEARLKVDLELKRLHDELASDFEMLQVQPTVKRFGADVVPWPKQILRRPIFAAAVALAAVALLSVAVSNLGTPVDGSVSSAQIDAPTKPVEESFVVDSFQRGLLEHFASLENTLERLPNESEASRQSLLNEAILENQMQILLARSQQQLALSRTLTSMGLTLEDLATGGVGSDEQRGQLIFMVSGMQTRMSAQASKASAAK
jgi:hypothetical protein